jgi:hypothetical protein
MMKLARSRIIKGAMAGAGLLMAASMAAPAAATVIIFGPDSCGGPATCTDFSIISQNFGDTADVNLSYRSASGPGNTASVNTRPLRFSELGVSGSNGAFVVPNGATPNQQAEIRFDLLSTGTITLGSVDFGTYFGSADLLDYRVYDGNWALLTSGSTLLDPGSLTRVVLNITSANGLILQFGPASVGGGIQNIDYSFDPPAVPEPASWAMLVAGFGLIGTTRRFRKEHRTLA